MPQRVLLLNGDYRPLAQITIPKTVNLMLADKVDPVEGVLRKLATVNGEFAVPTVVVLKRYVNVPSRRKKWSRGTVLERDNYTCVFCGKHPGDLQDDRRLSMSDFTVEHIRPVSRGGKNSWGNTACACYKCNNTKGNMMPHEAGMTLRWEPKTPRTDMWVAHGDHPSPWKKYIESGD